MLATSERNKGGIPGIGRIGWEEGEVEEGEEERKGCVKEQIEEQGLNLRRS